MKNFWNMAQLAFAAIGGGLGWFFGEMDGFFYALIAFVVIDYLTGVMCAILDKTLSSNVGFRGIFRTVVLDYCTAHGTTPADLGAGYAAVRKQLGLATDTEDND